MPTEALAVTTDAADRESPAGATVPLAERRVGAPTGTGDSGFPGHGEDSDREGSVVSIRGAGMHRYPTLNSVSVTVPTN